MSHPRETDLALYAGGDLSGWTRFRVTLHILRCPHCSASVHEYQAVKAAATHEFSRVPANFDWDRLADEMTANIRVGLEAGQCVSPSNVLQAESAVAGARNWLLSGWRQGLVYAGLGGMVIGSAWWLTLPAGQTRGFAQVVQSLFERRTAVERGVVLEATREGIELREGGRAYMTVLHPGASIKPASLTADLNGSMRARYVDNATGEVTIANVYAE